MCCLEHYVCYRITVIVILPQRILNPYVEYLNCWMLTMMLLLSQMADTKTACCMRCSSLTADDDDDGWYISLDNLS